MTVRSPDMQAIRALGVRRMTVDSRVVRPGDTFVAYPGESRDGRDYIAQAVRIDGALQVPALVQALQALMQRHEALRTSIDERRVETVVLEHVALGGEHIDRLGKLALSLVAPLPQPRPLEHFQCPLRSLPTSSAVCSSAIVR